jgi:hypothetical protein
MKKKKTHIVIIVVLVAFTILNIGFHLLRGNRNAIEETAARPATIFTVRTEDAELRTLQAYLEVNANIVSGNQVTVMPEANGRLVSMRV